MFDPEETTVHIHMDFNSPINIPEKKDSSFDSQSIVGNWRVLLQGIPELRNQMRAINNGPGKLEANIISNTCITPVLKLSVCQSSSMEDRCPCSQEAYIAQGWTVKTWAATYKAQDMQEKWGSVPNGQRQRKQGQVTGSLNVSKHRGIYLVTYQKEKIYKHLL